LIPIEKIWWDVHQRIGFFTKETAVRIPDTPGIYAWFLPLWLYHENLDELTTALRCIHLFDPVSSSHSTSVDFNWEELNILIEKQPRVHITVDLRGKWSEMLADSVSRQAFERALMEASILMPPLYIGKADALNARYAAHVDGRTDFAERFRCFVRKLPSFVATLQVSDLLFVCIEVDPKIAKTIREKKLHYLLEQIVMRVSGPTFSIK
jgi:hypothetical protein